MSELFTTRTTIPQAEALAVAVPPPPGELTDQQIASRHRLVRLHRALLGDSVHGPDFPFVESLSTLSHDEAQALLEEERARSSDGFYQTPNMEEYDAYVADLEQIRAEQQEHVLVSLSRIPEEAPMEVRRTAYLEALDHSPPLAAKTMHHLNEVAVRDMRTEVGRKLFSEERIAEVATDGELFRQALVQVMVKEPAIVLGASDVLSKVAAPDQIRTALDALRETDADSLMTHLDFALTYYTPDEGRELMRGLAEKHPSSMLFRLITKPELGGLVGDDVVRDTAIKAVKEGDYLPDQFSLVAAIDRGYVTRDDIKDRLAKDIAENPSQVQDGVFNNDKLVSLEDRAAFRQAAIDVYQAADESTFRSLSDCRILDRAAKQAVVEARFASDPAGTTETFGYLVDTYIAPDRARAALLARITNPTTEKEMYSRAWLVLSSKALTPADKQDFARKLSQGDPAQFLADVSLIDGTRGDALFGADELTSMVRRAAEGADLGSIAYGLRDFMSYMGDSKVQKQFIEERFTQRPELAIFTTTNRVYIDGLFTPDEQAAMLRQATDAILDGNASLGAYDLQIIREAFSDAQYKEVVDRLRVGQSQIVIDQIEEVAYLYTPDELSGFIQEVASTPEGQLLLLQALETPSVSWLDFVEEATAHTIIMSMEPKNHQWVLALGDRLELYMETEHMHDIAARIADNNPALSIASSDFFVKHLPGFDVNTVYERALSDRRFMPIAGKYLSAALGRAQRTGKESERDRLLRDASELYVLLNGHAQAGRLDELRSIRERLTLNGDGERELLEVYSLVAELGEPEDLEALRQLASMEEVNLRAVQVVARAVGITEQITVEQSNTFLEAMQRVAPLGAYIGQYRTQPEFREVLKSMTESLLQGTYADAWRFGPDTPDSFDSLRGAGLLPQQMTYEQYQVWRQESVSDYQETFSVETQGVVAEVRRILSDNEAALPAGCIIPAAEKNAALHTVSQRLAEIGPEVGKIHQELKVLRNQPDQEMATEQIEDLTATLVGLTVERRELETQQDVIQLLHMSEEEVRTGTLAPLAGSTKGRPLSQALQRLKKELAADAAFISQQIHGVFEGFNEQTGEVQDLHVVDTADPRRTIEIGETPVASCQNYRNGVMNHCLIGYTEPGTKILFVTNERGNPVARSIFRVLTDEQGNPALHVETVYSADASEGVGRAITRHALTKGTGMGVPVYVSLQSQNDEGNLVETRRVSGIAYEAVDTKLSSRGARAPYVYVDSLMGPQQNGRYSIKHLARIR